jgi:hypothetical protein
MSIDILPAARERSLRLHGSIHRNRDQLFPYKCSIPMERYRDRAFYDFLELTSREPILNTVFKIGNDLSDSLSQEMKADGVQMVIGTSPLIGLDKKGIPSTLNHFNHFLRSGAHRLPLKDRSVSSILSVATFEQTGFHCVKLNKMIEQIDPKIEKSLQNRYTPYHEFKCRMIEVILRKPGAQ